MCVQTRARGKAGSLTGPSSPQHGKQQEVQALPDTPDEPCVATMDKILDRIGGIEVSLAAVSDQNCIFRKQYELDTSTTRGADTAFAKQYAADIANLTDLLKNERRAKELANRELLITKQVLANAVCSNNRLEMRLNTMENSMKIRNVRIDGKPELDDEDLTAFISDIGHQLGLKNMAPEDIVSVYRIGKKNQQQRGNNRQRPRTIMIEFANIKARNTFFFARANLKNAAQFRGIYLNDDVTPFTRKMRDDYRSVANLARNAGSDVRVHTDGIVLDGTKFLLTEPHTLPARFSLKRAKTLEINDELYFHSEHSFLSNFYPSPIVEEGVVFTTAEHYYQALKCAQADDLDCRARVIAATTPLEAKRLADKLPETPEWRQARDDAMTRVLDAKFGQNAGLAELLVKTGDRPLNEATTNTHFGIGVGLHANEIKEKAYRGSNKLGIALVAKRNNIKAARAPPPPPPPLNTPAATPPPPPAAAAPPAVQPTVPPQPSSSNA